MRKFLIVTADDFGLHTAVNEAVEAANRAGILDAASLMVGAPAAADAVHRARGLPTLRVGLHVVLADGQAISAPDAIPGLADDAGRMDGRMFMRGVRYFALPEVRRQLEAEIRAQFAAFAATGLPLDHVNVHKHFHLHPTLLGILIRVGREFGMTAVRLPDEPVWFAVRNGGWAAAAGCALLAPWIRIMRRRLRAAGLFCNDSVFGIAASGAMDEATLLQILNRLPAGVTEIYLHPASRSAGTIAASMDSYRHGDELEALLSLRVRAARDADDTGHGGFADALAQRDNPRSRAGRSRFMSGAPSD